MVHTMLQIQAFSSERTGASTLDEGSTRATSVRPGAPPLDGRGPSLAPEGSGNHLAGDSLLHAGAGLKRVGIAREESHLPARLLGSVATKLFLPARHSKKQPARRTPQITGAILAHPNGSLTDQRAPRAEGPPGRFLAPAPPTRPDAQLRTSWRLAPPAALQCRPSLGPVGCRNAHGSSRARRGPSRGPVDDGGFKLAIDLTNTRARHRRASSEAQRAPRLRASAPAASSPSGAPEKERSARRARHSHHQDEASFSTCRGWIPRGLHRRPPVWSWLALSGVARPTLRARTPVGLGSISVSHHRIILGESGEVIKLS